MTNTDLLFREPELHLLPNTLLWMCHKRRIAVRPMKLQKLMYFACGFSLARMAGQNFDEKQALHRWPLPFNSDFYAFPYGPLEIEIYRNFADYEGDVIKTYMKKAEGFDLEGARSELGRALEEVLDRYGNTSDVQLSGLTHAKGTAWDTTWASKGGGPHYQRIEKSDIFHEFRNVRGIAPK